MPRLATLRRRVEMQGYCGLSDPELTALEPWLRVAPAFCAGWAAIATAAGSSQALGLLAAIAAIGAALPVHPFDVPYNAMVRYWLGTPPIPRSRLPRRFACSVAAVWLGAAAAAFALGQQTTGRLLGASFTLVALVPVTTGLCVPSWVLSRLEPRRRSARDGPRDAAAH